MSTSSGWGPSHQRTHRRTPIWLRFLIAAVIVAWLSASTGKLEYELPIPSILAIVGLVLLFRDLRSKAPTVAAPKLASGNDALTAVKQLARQEGDGVYLGLQPRGGMRFSRRQRAVLVLGPPRSGKTSAVIVPALIAHTGPAVCTSTKSDVATLTRAARGRSGRLWVFDPTGAGVPGGFERLRWSPVTGRARGSRRCSPPGR